MKIYVEKKTSKNGNSYISMYADIGYKKLMISYDASDIAEILDVKVSELYNLSNDNPIEVAKIIVKEK